MYRRRRQAGNGGGGPAVPALRPRRSGETPLDTRFRPGIFPVESAPNRLIEQERSRSPATVVSMNSRNTTRLFAAISILGTAACAAPAESPDPFRPVASVRQVMDAITIPASNVVFGVGSVEPATEAEWMNVRNAALALAESGNLLLMDGRAIDRGNWSVQSRALIDAAALAADAAEARNVDRVLDAGDAIYASCEGCHSEYLAKP
jgi:hypothetical protein